jgi:DNA-binding NarL/FixJ family response regulator
MQEAMTTAAGHDGALPPGCKRSLVEQKSLRLLLVDDHPVLRAGLRALLSPHSDFDVVAEAESGETAVALARDITPDVVLLDFTLPGMSGADATRCLKRDAPQTRVLALSVHDEFAVVRGLLDAGADGFLLKRSACDELVRAVRQVAAGVTYLDAALPRQTPEPTLRPRSPISGKAERLSEREAQVSKLLAQGLAMKEIAQQLSVSPRTLESYRARAMEKLGLKSRADLIRYAIRCGWLTAD